MPKTAKRFGVKNVFDVTQNVEAGAQYLRWLLDRFEGRVDLALAGYNAGEGAVSTPRRDPSVPRDRAVRVQSLGQRHQDRSVAVALTPDERAP